MVARDRFKYRFKMSELRPDLLSFVEKIPKRSLKEDFKPVLGLVVNEPSVIYQSVNFDFLVEYFLRSVKLTNIAFYIVDIPEDMPVIFFWASEWVLFVNSF